MSRSCKKHLSYIAGTDNVTCSVNGVVNVRQCSGCREFELNRVVKPPARPGITISREQHIGAIGTRLANIIKRETGGEVHCGVCESEVSRLNLLPKDAVLRDASALAERIVARGAEKAESWWQRTACRMIPEATARIVTGWIIEAANPSESSEKRSSSIRHLTYHIWPRIAGGDSWKWNLEQLAERWTMFNGVKCAGVAFCHQSEEPETVIAFTESLGMQFDHIIQRQNSPQLREVETWIPMLEFLNPESAGHDEVVFSAHAKGVRHDSGDTAIRDWTDLMYRACLDEWIVIESELQRHVATGAFKRYGNFSTPGNHNWHYSGTFFWWRLREIGQRNWRNVDQAYFGTESWIGHQCSPDETGCLFLDDCGDMYKADYWRETVWPAWSRSSWAAGQNQSRDLSTAT